MAHPETPQPAVACQGPGWHLLVAVLGAFLLSAWIAGSSGGCCARDLQQVDTPPGHAGAPVACMVQNAGFPFCYCGAVTVLYDTACVSVDRPTIA